ncbi:RAMP superfamily CRISPR-associated protein [Deltaproteobacteria bacterium TL4]
MAEAHSPYGFVPFSDQPVSRSSVKAFHEKFHPNLFHGELQFELENLTWLLVASGHDDLGFSLPAGDAKHFVMANGKPVIPGTTLKGTFRSIYEVLTNSCLSQINYKYQQILPQDYEPLKNNNMGLKQCYHVNNLCPACRLFGFMGRGRDSGLFHGRIQIGDALLKPETSPRFVDGIALPIQGEPKPKPRPNSSQYPDYFPDNKLAGRKMYYHWSEPPLKATIPKTTGNHQQAVESQPLEPGHSFQFTVRYTNLEEPEVANLLGSIQLPAGWAHHVGTGKSFGWGSCLVKLTGWKPFSTDRYRSLGAVSQERQGDFLKTETERLKRLIHNDRLELLQPFLLWENRPQRHYAFPVFQRR